MASALEVVLASVASDFISEVIVRAGVRLSQ